MNNPFATATLIERGWAGFQFNDQNTLILGVIDGHDDEVNPSLSESGFEDRNEVFRGPNSSSIRPVSLGVLEKVGVLECETKVGESFRLLLPADHAITMVFEDENHKIKV